MRCRLGKHCSLTVLMHGQQAHEVASTVLQDHGKKSMMSTEQPQMFHMQKSIELISVLLMHGSCNSKEYISHSSFV